jgi:hypothetical protein
MKKIQATMIATLHISTEAADLKEIGETKPYFFLGTLV